MASIENSFGLPLPPTQQVLDDIEAHVLRTLRGLGNAASLKHLTVERTISVDQERYSLNIMIETKKNIKDTLVELDAVVVTGRDATEPPSFSELSQSTRILPRERFRLDQSLGTILERETKDAATLTAGSERGHDQTRVLYIYSARSDQFQVQIEFGNFLRLISIDNADQWEIKVERLYRVVRSRPPLFSKTDG